MLNFRVVGTPGPQGSKRHVGNGVMIESSEKVKPWRQAVKYAALDFIAAGNPILGPVRVDITFLLTRPKGHYRTGRNAHLLRDAAPKFPAVKPDIDKLVRSTLDALGEAGVWHDDAQVAELHAAKTYGDMPGAVIHIRPLAQEATA